MAHSELVESLISRWIIEYECYELWKRFSDNLRTHQTWQALFIDHLSRTNHTNVFQHLGLKQQDDLEQTSMLLIKLMNSISSASKLPPDNNMEIITPLEESLKYIDKLNDCRMKDAVKVFLLKLRKVIKQECVVICFRCYKLRLAKTIYERVWSNCSNPKELSTKSNLMNLFKDNVNIAVALESFPVSELSDNCKKFFSKYFNNLLVPFVIRNAEKIFDTFAGDLGLICKKKKITSENSKSKHFLIQCWFADYFCYQAWKNMDSVDSIKFDWLLKFVSENIDLETRSCLFIRFMFKFIERKNADESLNSYLSPLELCLGLLDKAEKLHAHKHDGTEKALLALRLELKKHVVLMWCNKNMYEKAKTVFNKLFDESTAETDVALRFELENILKGNKQFSLDESKLKQSVRNYFTMVLENDSYPYLLYVAESVVKKMRSKGTKSSSTQPYEGGKTEARKRQRTTKKLPDDFISTDNIEEEASRKKKKDFHRPAPSTRNDDDSDDDNIQDADDNLDLENDESRDEKKRKSEKKRNAWSEEEEVLIYRGVLLYGVGNWLQIAKYMLVSRTKNEVKEKWRAMVKQGKVKKYAAELGPIPGYYLDNMNDSSVI